MFYRILLVIVSGWLLTVSCLAHAGFIPRKTQYGYPACYSKADLDRALGMMSSGDRGAVAGLVERGRCIILKGGDVVFVEEQSLMGGWAKVRPQGMNIILFVPTEAIK
jgi:hypothetical protein